MEMIRKYQSRRKDEHIVLKYPVVDFRDLSFVTTQMNSVWTLRTEFL